MENLSVFLAVPVWLCQTLAAILSITLIDLVLSGDNAAVIGLAIRNLPRPMQKKSGDFRCRRCYYSPGNLYNFCCILAYR